MSALVFIQVMQGFKPWFLCFAAPLPFDSSSALLLLFRNSEMPFPHWLWQAPGVLSIKFSHVAEASGMYLLEAESGLLYFSAPAPPIDLSAEVAESLLSLSLSFKSWGWHTVRLMTKFTMLRAIVSDVQITQAMIVSSAKLRLWFKDIPCKHRS